MNDEVIWTDLTATDVAKRLAETGTPVSVHVVEQLFEVTGFGRRQAQKTCSMGEHPDRNAQFLRIAEFKKEYFDSLNPLLSIDTKKKELLGNFYRDGKLFTKATIGTFDHDFPSFAKGVVIPHGTASAYQTCVSDRTSVRNAVLAMHETILPRRLSFLG